MFKFFNTFFETETEKPIDTQHRIQFITATLLIEVSKADFSQDDNETQRIEQLLSGHFELSTSETQSIIDLAQNESDHLISIQHLTRELNENMSQQEKVSVIEMMWHVVYADGSKDCYEEHLMRKISDLLYVSHSDFIKARHKAEL